MDYQARSDFIKRRMRMSHTYQAVMLLALLEGQGRKTVEQIARAILVHDQSQVEYYEEITKNMPGKVLRSHGIVEMIGDTYR